MAVFEFYLGERTSSAILDYVHAQYKTLTRKGEPKRASDASRNMARKKQQGGVERQATRVPTASKRAEKVASLAASMEEFLAALANRFPALDVQTSAA